MRKLSAFEQRQYQTAELYRMAKRAKIEVLLKQKARLEQGNDPDSLQIINNELQERKSGNGTTIEGPAPFAVSKPSIIAPEKYKQAKRIFDTYISRPDLVKKLDDTAYNKLLRVQDDVLAYDAAEREKKTQQAMYDEYGNKNIEDYYIQPGTPRLDKSSHPSTEGNERKGFFGFIGKTWDKMKNSGKAAGEIGLKYSTDFGSSASTMLYGSKGRIKQLKAMQGSLPKDSAGYDQLNDMIINISNINNIKQSMLAGDIDWTEGLSELQKRSTPEFDEAKQFMNEVEPLMHKMLADQYDKTTSTIADIGIGVLKGVGEIVLLGGATGLKGSKLFMLHTLISEALPVGEGEISFKDHLINLGKSGLMGQLLGFASKGQTKAAMKLLEKYKAGTVAAVSEGVGTAIVGAGATALEMGTQLTKGEKVNVAEAFKSGGTMAAIHLFGAPKRMQAYKNTGVMVDNTMRDLKAIAEQNGVLITDPQWKVARKYFVRQVLWGSEKAGASLTAKEKDLLSRLPKEVNTPQTKAVPKAIPGKQTTQKKETPKSVSKVLKTKVIKRVNKLETDLKAGDIAAVKASLDVLDNNTEQTKSILGDSYDKATERIEAVREKINKPEPNELNDLMEMHERAPEGSDMQKELAKKIEQQRTSTQPSPKQEEGATDHLPDGTKKVEVEKPFKPRAGKQPFEMTKDDYVDSDIYIKPGVQRKGLGGWKLNEAVNRLKKEHKEAVTKALSEGKTVPQEVLKDYPDLQTQPRDGKAHKEVDAEDAKSGPLKRADIPKDVQRVMPIHQQKVLVGSPEHWDTLKRLEKEVNEIPALYSQDGKGKDAIVHAHYFTGGTDIFITEYDEAQDKFFGYTILNGDYQMSEFGYQSATELRNSKMTELDFFWQKKTLQEALENTSDYFKPTEAKADPAFAVPDDIDKAIIESGRIVKIDGATMKFTGNVDENGFHEFVLLTETGKEKVYGGRKSTVTYPRQMVELILKQEAGKTLDSVQDDSGTEQGTTMSEDELKAHADRIETFLKEKRENYSFPKIHRSYLRTLPNKMQQGQHSAFLSKTRGSSGGSTYEYIEDLIFHGWRWNGRAMGIGSKEIHLMHKISQKYAEWASESILSKPITDNKIKITEKQKGADIPRQAGTPDFEYEPHDGWENNLIKARDYANSLKIDWKGMSTDLDKIVSSIKTVLGEGKADFSVEAKKIYEEELSTLQRKMEKLKADAQTHMEDMFKKAGIYEQAKTNSAPKLTVARIKEEVNKIYKPEFEKMRDEHKRLNTFKTKRISEIKKELAGRPQKEAILSNGGSSEKASSNRPNESADEPGAAGGTKQGSSERGTTAGQKPDKAGTDAGTRSDSKETARNVRSAGNAAKGSGESDWLPERDTDLERHNSSGDIGHSDSRSGGDGVVSKQIGTNYDLTQSAPIQLTKGERRSTNAQVKEILKRSPEEMTDADKEILRQYTGEGGLSSGTKEALTQHYTDYPTIKAIHKAIETAGLIPKRVLEPGAGNGNFLGMRPGYNWTTVDIDGTNNEILKRLYPKARHYLMSYEDYIDTDFELVVSNVPFLEVRSSRKNRPDIKTLHDFYFVHSLDRVKDGGVVAFVTSKYTMDGLKQAVRREIVSKADIVGAFRLPGSHFEKHAHTSVTADIIFMQKRPAGTEPSDRQLIVNNNFIRSTDDTANPSLYLNDYYRAHPDNILGDMSVGINKQYGNKQYVVEGEANLDKIKIVLNKDYLKGLKDSSKSAAKSDEPYVPDKWVGKPGEEMGFPDWARGSGKVFRSNVVVKETMADGEVISTSYVDDDYALNLIEENGKFYGRDKEFKFKDVTGSAKTYKPITGQKAKKLRMLQEITDNADKFQETGNKIYADEAINELRNYKEKYKKHPADDKTFRDMFKKLDETTYLDALTSYFDENLRPSEVLKQQTRYTGSGKREVTAKSKLTDRALAEENREGIINFDRAVFVGKDERKALAEKGYSFAGVNGKVQMQNDITYYSGNVYKKINNAKALLETVKDKDVKAKFEEQITKLEALKPQRKIIEEINIKGSEGWLSEWERGQIFPNYSKVRNSTTNLEEISAGVGEVFDNYLNNKALIRRQKDEMMSEYWQRMEEAEAIVENTLNSIKARINNNRTLRASLEDKYNESFNGYVYPDYVKASYIISDVLGEIAENTGGKIKLRKNQVEWITQAIYEGKGINAHDMGGGKTYAAIALARALKIKGMSKKPMFVVPAKTILKWEQEILELFPKSKIINLGNLSKAKREKNLLRLANTNADYVLISTEGFTNIGMNKDNEIKYLNEYFAEQLHGFENRQLALMMEKFESYKEVIKNRKKNPRIDFEKLGIDAIIADEAHAYKNVGYSGKVAASGIATPFGLTENEKTKALSIKSYQSYDFRFKSSYITDRNNGNNIFLLTGSPTPNKPMEIYTMFSHLNRDLFKEFGIHSADEFADMFLKIKNVDQNNKSVRRLHKMTNVQALKMIKTRFMDYRRMKDMPWIKLPTPKVHKHYVKQSDELAMVMDDVGKRYADAKKERIKHKGDDTIIGIYQAGRGASIDPRLYADDHADPNAIQTMRSFDTGTDKIEFLLQEVGKVRKADKNAGQIIFLDRNGSKIESIDKDLHREIKENLINTKKFKSKEIAIISGNVITDPTTGEEKKLSGDRANRMKQNIADTYNAGDVKIVIGTTKSMGEGMNLNRYTREVWNMDIPYNPDDYEQRNARGVRYGNTYDDVNIHYLFTQGGFDELSYAIIGKKVSWQTPFYGSSDANEIELSTDSQGSALPSADEIALNVEQDPVQRILLRRKMLRESMYKARNDLKRLTDTLAGKILRGEEKIKEREAMLKGQRIRLNELQPKVDIKDVKKRTEAFGKSKKHLERLIEGSGRILTTLSEEVKENRNKLAGRTSELDIRKTNLAAFNRRFTNEEGKLTSPTAAEAVEIEKSIGDLNEFLSKDNEVRKSAEIFANDTSEELMYMYGGVPLPALYDDLRAAMGPLNNTMIRVERAVSDRHGQQNFGQLYAKDQAHILRDFTKKHGISKARQAQILDAIEADELEILDIAELGLARKWKTMFDFGYDFAAKYGVIRGALENYVPHIYKNVQKGKRKSGSLNKGTGFGYKRSIPTRREARKQGYETVDDMAVIAFRWWSSVGKAIADKQFVEELHLIDGLTDGELFSEEAKEGFEPITEPSLARYYFAGTTSFGATVELTDSGKRGLAHIDSELKTAVMREGATRAIRLFDSQEEAALFISKLRSDRKNKNKRFFAEEREIPGTLLRKKDVVYVNEVYADAIKTIINPYAKDGKVLKAYWAAKNNIKRILTMNIIFHGSNLFSDLTSEFSFNFVKAGRAFFGNNKVMQKQWDSLGYTNEQQLLYDMAKDGVNLTKSLDVHYELNEMFDEVFPELKSSATLEDFRKRNPVSLVFKVLSDSLWSTAQNAQKAVYLLHKARYIKKGFSAERAGKMAAHFTNDQIGSLPRYLFKNSRVKILNWLFFARNWTISNLRYVSGAMEYGGEPFREFSHKGFTKDELHAMGDEYRKHLIKNILGLFATKLLIELALHGFDKDEADFFDRFHNAEYRKHFFEVRLPMKNRKGGQVYAIMPLYKTIRDLAGWGKNAVKTMYVKSDALTKQLVEQAANYSVWQRSSIVKPRSTVKEAMQARAEYFVRGLTPYGTYSSLPGQYKTTVEKLLPLLGAWGVSGTAGGPQAAKIKDFLQKERLERDKTDDLIDEMIMSGDPLGALQEMGEQKRYDEVRNALKRLEKFESRLAYDWSRLSIKNKYMFLKSLEKPEREEFRKALKESKDDWQDFTRKLIRYAKKKNYDKQNK